MSKGKLRDCRVSKGNNETVESLLDLGRDPNKEAVEHDDSFFYGGPLPGKYPLHTAVFNRHSDPRLFEEGDTAVHSCVRSGQIELAHVFLEEGGVDPNLRSLSRFGRNCTLLHAAAEIQDKNLVSFLASPNAMDGEGNSAISICRSLAGGQEGQMGGQTNVYGSVESIIRKWPTTMLVIALQYIDVFNLLDFSSLNDLYLFIGQEDDYIWDI